MKNFIIGAALLLLAGIYGDVRAIPSDDEVELTHILPSVRGTPLLPPAPVSISAAALRPFSLTPMVLGALPSNAPRIVSGQGQRNYFGRGDAVYAEGELDGMSEFRLVRRGRKLIDPYSHEYLGDELVQLGRARLAVRPRHGLNSLLITDATQEIIVGDYLLALLPEAPPLITPHQPATAINALILSVSTNEGSAYAAQNQIVAINKGARDGVSAGAQLRLHKAACECEKNTSSNAGKNMQSQQMLTVPAEESARLLIIRVFDRVSYGLITQAREPVQVGDKALAPQPENKDAD